MQDNEQSKKFLLALIITSLFLICHQSNILFSSYGKDYITDCNGGQVSDPFHINSNIISQHKSKIIKIPNNDASLSPPYLDKISKYWYIGGSTQVRNDQSVKLTSKNIPHTHGSIISNGIGDNTINDFETEFVFRLPFVGNDLRSIGDGISFVLTSQNDFLLKDLTSSFASRQYMINSGGILPNDISMMGFPKNLPGLSLVLDTFANDPRNKEYVPFLDIFLNSDPQSGSYDIDSDGSKSTIQRLNKDHIKLRKNVYQGDMIHLRIIYIESISFLKVDIQYENVGNYWIELFSSNDLLDTRTQAVFLPKNERTGQRFIGMGALNGDLTETVELFYIKTSEFHWNANINEEDLSDFNHYKEWEKFLLKDFHEQISNERDSFTRWKMIKSQPMYGNHLQETTKLMDLKQLSDTKLYRQKESKRESSLWRFLRSIFKWMVIISIIMTLYLFSIYIRVSKKHWKRIQSKKFKRSLKDSLLPI